jgi:choloylglycine hydrolase
MKPLFIIWLITFYISSCLGCSDFQLKSQDGTIICGRAMDFIMDMDSKIMAFNRGDNRSSIAPNGMRGLTWISKYGLIGVNAFGYDGIDEGMNEKGLTCGVLVLDSTKYPHIRKQEYNISLMIMDVCTWILGSFSTVNEVTKYIGSVRIWGNVMPKLNVVL